MHACIGEGNGNPLQYSCWRIPGTEEPAGLPSMGSHRVRHDWSGATAAGSWLLGFDFCKHGLLLGTMMTQWLWTHCVPFYQLGHASQHQREIRKLSTGVNYRKEGRNSLAKKQPLWIPGPGCWWRTVCTLSSLACIFSPWGFDFASFPVKSRSPSLGPLKLGRPGVLGRSGRNVEGRAGPSLPVFSEPCERAWSSLWAEGWARSRWTRPHRWGHLQPSSLQRTTDTRGNPAKTRRTAPLNPLRCHKPLDSGVVCLPKLYWYMGSSSKTSASIS